MLNSAIKDNLNMLIEPILKEEEYSLIETNYYLQGKRWRIRLFIDKINGGITLDECARLNQRIADLIERAGIINQAYILEVSSPGTDRPLYTYEDFSRCLNRRVRVFFRQPQEGRDEISGVVTAVTERGIDLDLGDRQEARHLGFDQIRKGKQIIEADK